MSWSKGDDGLLDNQKVLSVSVPARWLWWTSIVWCSKHLTDGHIPANVALHLFRSQIGEGDHQALFSELLSVRNGHTSGLWEHDKNGDFLVHDYLAYNRSKASILKEREDRREGGRLGAHHRWKKGEPIGQPIGEPIGQPMGARHSTAMLPSRPDPLPKREGGSEGRSAPGGGRRPPPKDQDRNPVIARQLLDRLAKLPGWQVGDGSAFLASNLPTPVLESILAQAEDGHDCPWAIKKASE